MVTYAARLELTEKCKSWKYVSHATTAYEKVSDWGPVWVRIDVIFQVPEKSNFDEPNQSQVVLLGVWNKDFTKKSHLFACVHANNPLRARAYKS